MSFPKDTLRDLSDKAQLLRKNVILGTGIGCPSYIGGALSAADIVAALYFKKMNHSPTKKLPNRDRFILSKGHAAILQYAALAMCGYFPLEEISETRHPDERLQGFADYLQCRDIGIEAPAGTLGQGLSMGVGIALGLKLDEITAKVYVLLGDGEMAGGQNWEAAMAASNFGLNNLVAIVDKNGMQAQGRTVERFNQGMLSKKLAAFGFNVIEIDGHDMGAILTALDDADNSKFRPVAIIASTKKGKGLDFAENNPTRLHNTIFTAGQYSRALSAFGGASK